MPNGAKLDPRLSQLFRPANIDAVVKKGGLITFKYNYWHHDPYPLVIVTDISPGNRIRGVNIHYLTFNYVRNLLKANGENPAFSYQSIKGDNYLVAAFRTYKWNGISQIKKMDSQFILTVMSMVRTFDPIEVENIRKVIQEQLRMQVNPRADEMTKQTMTTQPTTPSIGPIQPGAGTLGETQ